MFLHLPRGYLANSSQVSYYSTKILVCAQLQCYNYNVKYSYAICTRGSLEIKGY